MNLFEFLKPGWKSRKVSKRISAIDKISNIKTLFKIAKTDISETVVTQAIYRLAKVIAESAATVNFNELITAYPDFKYSKVRLALIHKYGADIDKGIIINLLESDDSWEVRQSAALFVDVKKHISQIKELLKKPKFIKDELLKKARPHLSQEDLLDIAKRQPYHLKHIAGAIKSEGTLFEIVKYCHSKTHYSACSFLLDSITKGEFLKEMI